MGGFVERGGDHERRRFDILYPQPREFSPGLGLVVYRDSEHVTGPYAIGNQNFRLLVGGQEVRLTRGSRLGLVTIDGLFEQRVECVVAFADQRAVRGGSVAGAKLRPRFP